jgi:hypothetical protein
MHVQAAEAVIDWEYDWETAEVVDSEPDLDADPEPDGITPGFSLRLHRTGHWAVCINGEHHKFFLRYDDAKAYLARAEADWQELGLPRSWEPRPSAFEGHPAQEGGE